MSAPMIIRIWRGWTTPENADAYQRIVSEEVLTAIADRDLAGYQGAYLLGRETVNGEVEFATIMHFDDLDAVRAFAGEDYEAAFVPPRAREVLDHFDERSAHYEVLLTPDETR
jgi:heme-degrading monooxygenase HmoA